MQAFKTYFFAALFFCFSTQVTLADAEMDFEPADEMISEPISDSAEEFVDDAPELDAEMHNHAEHMHDQAVIEAEVAESDIQDTANEQVMNNDIDEESVGITPTSVLSEIIIRPVAVLGSAAGFCFFVIASPVAALADIAEPHDELERSWNNLVVVPFDFAFRRPLGDYSVEMHQS